MPTIKLANREVIATLNKLQKKASDISPALLEIGELLTESTKQRFADKESPDGKKWKSNSPTTIKKKGKDAPLTGETGVLGNTINYNLKGNSVEIGSPQEYAAIQQFGGKKSEFPNLFGDIPARPFLGLSDGDEKEVLKIIKKHLQNF